MTKVQLILLTQHRVMIIIMVADLEDNDQGFFNFMKRRISTPPCSNKTKTIYGALNDYNTYYKKLCYSRGDFPTNIQEAQLVPLWMKRGKKQIFFGIF